MRSLTFVFCFLLLGWLSAVAQVAPAQTPARVTVSGTVQDAATGDGLLGVSVYVQEVPTVGTATNAHGAYALPLPPGSYTLVIRYVGYGTQHRPLTLAANQQLDVSLKASERTLGEVTVTGRAAAAVPQRVEMSTNQLSGRTVKAVPPLLGEADVVRAVQLLPGVSTVAEGATGFNVRGGNIDQNLIIQDEAIIYNSSHLLGLFSVFNPDAVQDVTLYKGGLPARYGGRLSSVLEVRLREGSDRKFAASGGIGTVSSRLTLEVPVVQDRASFIVSGRRTYADVLLGLSSDENIRHNRLFFYDLSAKGHVKLNPTNTLYVSGYVGQDALRFDQELRANWGNQTGTLRWNHVFGARLFANFTAAYSNYHYELAVPTGTLAFRQTAGIGSTNLKGDFAYAFSPRNTFTFGASYLRHRFDPGRVRPVTEGSVFNAAALPIQDADEYSAYIDHALNLGARLTARYGLRWSGFNYLAGTATGPVYDYVSQNGPTARKTPVNPRTFAPGRTIAFYQNYEPRASLKYELTDNSSVQVSYNRVAQYLHLLSASNAATPFDQWQPSTNNIQPELADQVGLGYFRTLGEGAAYSASVEVYGKRLTNQIEYVDGSNLDANAHREGELLYGRGRAYGAEFHLKKNNGPLTGWVSYTLSRTERQVAGINNGAWYASRFDRPHNLAVTGQYERSKRWSFSSTFSFSSGSLITVPNARYYYQGLILPDNTEARRNNYRIPAYHRLDLAATFHPARNEGRRWQGEWVFSVYNAYGRRNAATVYFLQRDEEQPASGNLITEAKRLAVLGTFLPSVTYNFSF